MVFFIFFWAIFITALAGVGIALTTVVAGIVDRISAMKRGQHVSSSSSECPRCSCMRCRTGLPNGAIGTASRGVYRSDLGGTFVGTSEVRS